MMLTTIVDDCPRWVDLVCCVVIGRCGGVAVCLGPAFPESCFGCCTRETARLHKKRALQVHISHALFALPLSAVALLCVCGCVCVGVEGEIPYGRSHHSRPNTGNSESCMSEPSHTCRTLRQLPKLSLVLRVQDPNQEYMHEGISIISFTDFVVCPEDSPK